MKRHIINSSKLRITTVIASLTITAIMVGGTAFAGPDKPEEQTTEPQVITETEVTPEAVDIPNPVESEVLDNETTQNEIIIEEKTVVLGTDDNGEPFYPADALDPVSEPELTQTSTDTASYVCHIQPDGDTECICKDDASCEALTNSEECQPHTEWRDSDLGGCTQKTG